MARDVYEVLIRRRDLGQPTAMATVIAIQGSVPGSEALKMLIDGDGRRVAGTIGGGCVEAEVLTEAVAVIRDERPRQLSFNLTEEETGTEGLICGGRLTVFVEPIVSPTVVLFGAGHLSKSIDAASRLAGFRTVVIDDREAFANRERFPDASDVRCGEFIEVASELPIGAASYLVIVTRGHSHDRDVLRWAVGTDARYIGMIGSRRKVLTTFRALVDEGLATEAFERVCAPVGLDIGAVTHEEIAIAVVAELISVRREGYKRAADGPRRPYVLLSEGAEEVAQ